MHSAPVSKLDPIDLPNLERLASLGAYVCACGANVVCGMACSVDYVELLDGFIVSVDEYSGAISCRWVDLLIVALLNSEQLFKFSARSSGGGRQLWLLRLQVQANCRESERSLTAKGFSRMLLQILHHNQRSDSVLDLPVKRVCKCNGGCGVERQNVTVWHRDWCPLTNLLANTYTNLLHKHTYPDVHHTHTHTHTYTQTQVNCPQVARARAKMSYSVLAKHLRAIAG